MSNEDSQCHLIGDLFSYFIQFILFCVSMTLLIVKRSIEWPQREWKIWAMDVSKQLIGAFFIHFANIAISEWIMDGDECAFYFFNFLIDCTVGVGIVYLLHTALCKICSLHNIGFYGQPPKMRAWFKQFLIYLMALMTNKAIIGTFLLKTQTKLNDFGNWLFSPLRSQPNIELIIVMIIFPLILSSFQYWTFDIMLKQRQRAQQQSTNYTSLSQS